MTRPSRRWSIRPASPKRRSSATRICSISPTERFRAMASASTASPSPWRSNADPTSWRSLRSSWAGPESPTPSSTRSRFGLRPSARAESPSVLSWRKEASPVASDSLAVVEPPLGRDEHPK